MAGLIKKQILKHLSKFAKNLSADSIQLSTLKGEGELSNLELDCIAIQNLVDLPTWLQINDAKCNKVHVKIPWTKLKTTPITIFLDTVELNMVTCEKPRPPNGPSPIEASASSGDSSYGFIEKVLEGIAVRINSINVNFSSEVFKAEFQLSQLMVYSTDPDGKKADLRFTRIMNKAWGQVLTFKKVTWQTMRIVTDAATVQTGGLTTPIRLITNQATLRIVLRRKLSNLSVLASQLHIQFDDLLWVLTDAQVQSAMLCVKSIRETIERSQQQGRAANPGNSPSTQTISPPVTPNVSDATPSTPCDPYFLRHIIHESSYHYDVDRIDLHICDDGSNPNKEATYKKIVEGGAILITLFGLKFDHYPSHKAGKIRTYFRDYNDIAAARDKWAEEIIVKFRKDFVELKKAAVSAGFKGPKTSAKLLESCMFFRLGDIEIGQVSSSSDKERSSNKLLSSSRKELLLPDDMPLASVIITDYYYPDDRDYPAPHRNIFMRTNTPYLRAHWPSLLWLNQLSLTTIKSVQKMLEELGVVVGGDPLEEEHADIRIEALMPKIFIPSPTSSSDPDTPEGIEIQVSQAAVTNCRQGENSSRKGLSNVLKSIKESFMKKNSAFPSESGHEFDFLHHVFDVHADARDMPITSSMTSEKPELRSSSLKQKAYKDVWSVWIRQIWMDFVMKASNDISASNTSVKNTSSCFIDSVPVSMWITKNVSALQNLAEKEKSKPHKTTSLPTTPSQCENKVIGVRKTQSDLSMKSKVAHDEADTCSDVTSSEANKHPLQNESDTNPSEDKRPRRNKTLLEFYRTTAEEESPPEDPVKLLEGPASTYVLIGSDKPMRLALDHHQFLFLLRLMDSIQGIGEKVVTDTSNILFDGLNSATSKTSTSSTEANDSDTTAVRLALPSVELYLVLRPTSSKLTDNSEPPPKNIEVGRTPPAPLLRTDPLRFITPDPLRPITPSSSECSSLDTVSILGDDMSATSVFSSVGKSLEDPLTNSRADRTSLPASPTFGRSRGTTEPSATLRLKTEQRLNSKIYSGVTSSMSCDNVSSRSTTISSSGYETFSIDSLNTASPMNRDDDVNSIASSGTSSLDQFVLLDMDSPSNQDTIINFKTQKIHITKSDTSLSAENIVEPTEVSQSEINSNPMTDSQLTMVNGVDTPYSDNISADASPQNNQPTNHKMISLLKIEASNGVDLCVDSHIDGSVVRLCANQAKLHEVVNMSLEELQNSFTGSVSNSSTSIRVSDNILPTVRMRIDSGSCATRFYPCVDGHMTLKVDNLNEKVLSSTLANLGAFLEDDVIPEVLPMSIEAHDVVLTIEDDTDPVYPSTAKPPPVVLNVHHANVKRDPSGVFHVQTQTSAASIADLLMSLPPTPDRCDATTSCVTNPEEASPSSESVAEAVSTSDCNDVADDVTSDSSDDKYLTKATQVFLEDVTSHMTSLERNLAEVTSERDALLDAIHKMQDDLLMSENERNQLRAQLTLKSR